MRFRIFGGIDFKVDVEDRNCVVDPQVLDGPLTSEVVASYITSEYESLGEWLYDWSMLEGNEGEAFWNSLNLVVYDGTTRVAVKPADFTGGKYTPNEAKRRQTYLERAQRWHAQLLEQINDELETKIYPSLLEEQ